MKTILNPNNHLFELARTGQRLPHLAVAVVMSFVFILAAQFSGGTLAVLIVLFLSGVGLDSLGDPEVLAENIMPDTALEQTIFLILAFAPNFVLLWFWVRFVEKRAFSSLGLELKQAGMKYLRGVLVGLGMFAAAVGISAVFGYIAVEQQSSQPQGVAALGGVLLVFLGWTVQGPAEEIVTRGWLLPVLGARYRPALGILLSSLVFTVFHALNPNLSGVALLNLFLFGLFAALYALYEGGMWGVFSIHAVWNWAQGNLFGFEVSGGQVPGGALIDLMETGPDLITGGPFGPEGGLAVTAVLLLSCALVVVLAGRADQKQF